MKDFAKSIRTNNSLVCNKATVLKDGNVWVVLYANETKSQEFESEAEAREFAKKVGNSNVGNADLPTEQDLKNWIRMMEQDKREAQREMDKWKHHTEGQYSGDQFNTAMVKYNEAVSQIKKMQEELRQGKFKKTGNSNVGNETIGPNWDKKRQLEDELRGWMTMVNKLDGDERRNAEKQIADIRKELNDVKIKIAHGENKKAGNESIDKQEWTMFNGLKKDAEKEIGNATGDEYNAEIQRLTKKAEQLRRMGQGRSAMEIEKQIEKLGKEMRELGNSKTGNETKAERKFGKVMGEFEEGALKTPQGKTVTDPSQAKAIAYSEADKVDNLKRARNSIKK